jgi:phage internal scaffolding protein
MSNLPYRTAYSERVPSKTNIQDFGESLTVQEQKESTDVNNILRRFQQTGLIEHVNQNEGQYGEFGSYDFQENQNMIKRIESSFNELPSSVRNQFGNNPQEWVEHLANPDNIEDMKDGVIDNDINLATEAALSSGGTEPVGAESGATKEPTE